ncbi:MAG: hypothetical protein ACRDNS_27555, partial [Trebonia sp.]
ARDRVHIDPEQQRAEDQALEAAHQDRTDGKSTLVIAQSSNEHLDELNARAQAIRKQHKQLGEEQIAVPGRPYGLHAGDQIQVRHTITHPDHGQLRNGTGATITDVDPRSGELVLRLTSGKELVLDQEQIEQVDLRLAYVQHPFPAQGHTTDTTHVIIASQATREGTYVALTRAREQTQIYSAVTDPTADADRLEQLAERVSQTEPEIPSISMPLAHEQAVTREIWRAAAVEPVDSLAAERHTPEPERQRERPQHDAEPARRWPRSTERDQTARELDLETEPTWTMEW